MKIKLKNILMISFLAVAGIFGVSSALISKQVDENPIVEKAEAGSQSAESSRIWFEDQGSKGWSTDGNDIWVEITNYTFDGTCGYSSSNLTSIPSSDFKHNSTWSGHNTYVEIRPGNQFTVKMAYTEWKDNYKRCYSIIFPWYLRAFRAKFFCIRNSKQCYLWQGTSSSEAYHYDLSIGKNINIYSYGDSGLNPWFPTDTIYRSQVSSEETSSSYTHDQDTYTFAYETNGGSSIDTETLLTGKKATYAAPVKGGKTFYRWTITNGGDDQWAFNRPVNSNTVVYAAYKNYYPFRLWFWRSSHYANSDYEWKIWDGVDGSAAYAPTGYQKINSADNQQIYLAYYDLPSGGINKINFQVFYSGSISGTVSSVGEISYSAGDNSKLWYATSGTTVATDGTPKTMSSSGFDYKVDANTLGKIFGAYFTCLNDANNGYPAVDDIYSTWVYNNSDGSNVYGQTDKAGADSVLQSNTIYDFAYNGGNYNYSDLSTKTVTPTIYSKYETMHSMKTNGKVYALGNFGSIFSYSNGSGNDISVIIIIIASSVALLSITALSVLVVKKRKTKE